MKIKNILKWFRLNSWKANFEKFQFMMLGDKTRHEHIIKTKKTWVQSNDAVTLLGVIIDKNLTFKKHIEISHNKKPLKYWVMLLIQLCTFKIDLL